MVAGVQIADIGSAIIAAPLQAGFFRQAWWSIRSATERSRFAASSVTLAGSLGLLLGRQSNRSVEPDGLAIQHFIFDDVFRQRRILRGFAQT